MAVFMISGLYSTVMAVDMNVLRDVTFDEVLRYIEKADQVSDKLDKSVGDIIVCHNTHNCKWAIIVVGMLSHVKY